MYDFTTRVDLHISGTGMSLESMTDGLTTVGEPVCSTGRVSSREESLVIGEPRAVSDSITCEPPALMFPYRPIQLEQVPGVNGLHAPVFDDLHSPPGKSVLHAL